MKKRLCGRGVGGGVALIIKTNCPDMTEGSFYVKIDFRIVKINNGNCTEWSAIWSEIIRVI